MYPSKEMATTQKLDAPHPVLSRESTATARPPGCLVIATHEARRGLLSAAAADTGWSTKTCDTPKSAKALIIRERLQMAVVDLESEDGRSPEELKDLSERLAREKGLLLVLCGNEGNAMEEIWARQLGVWLYLPGVVDDSDLGSLFEEAKRIAQRRQMAARSARGRPHRGAATA